MTSSPAGCATCSCAPIRSFSAVKSPDQSCGWWYSGICSTAAISWGVVGAPNGTAGAPIGVPECPSTVEEQEGESPHSNAVQVRVLQSKDGQHLSLPGFDSRRRPKAGVHRPAHREHEGRQPADSTPVEEQPWNGPLDVWEGAIAHVVAVFAKEPSCSGTQTGAARSTPCTAAATASTSAARRATGPCAASGRT